MSQLGKAYIEVTADLKKFPAELRTKLKAALKEGLEGVEFTEFENKAKAAGERAGSAAGDGFNRRVKKKVEDSGKSGALGFLKSLTSVFDREKGSKGGFFESVGKLFSSATEQGTKAAAEKLGQLANVSGQIGGALSSIGGGIGSVLQIGALAIIIPVVIQLAGAVVQLGGALFALPAAAGVALAVIAPLIIAFQGMGEAIGAGLSGDTEKFNQALKGLAPSARAVAKEFVSLGPALKAIKSSVQQAFFAPLVGALKPLATTLLPTLASGLSLVATQLGKFAAGFVELLTAPDILDDLDDLFRTTAQIVAALGPSLINLFGSFFGIMEKGLPFVLSFFQYLARGADSLVEFLKNAQAGGKVNEWLERAGHILKTVITIAKQLGQYLLAIFGGEIGDNGTAFLDEFKDKLQDLLDFINSPDGKESIHNLGVLLQWVGKIFLFLVATEPAMLRGLNAVFDGVRALAKGLEWLGGAVVIGAKAIGSFFVAVWGYITGAGSAIGNFFTRTIPSWWDSVVSFFESLPDKVVAALRGFQTAGRDFLIGALRSWYEQVFQWIGNIIGIIWSLPQLIPAAFEVLKTNIWNEITATWQGVVDLFWWGVHSTWAVIMAIPGVLGDAMSAVGTFFHDLWFGIVMDVQNTVEIGFHKVLDFFQSLPGRIADLGPRLYVAAVQLGHRIGDGLANIGTFASDVGRKIVNTIKSGINWVIGSINSGIAEIDDKLPGTLPRIPMLARGAVVDSPTLALVGEAGPEVVVPLSNPKRAQELAQQSGLLSMLRGVGRSGATLVQVWLDPSGVLIPITKQVVTDTLDEQGHDLAYARAA